MSVTNASAANAALDSIREEKHDQRVEAVENESVRQRLMDGRERELTVEVVITGTPVEFVSPGVDVQKQSIELAKQYEDVDAEELDSEEIDPEEFDADNIEAGLSVIDFIAGVLAEHSVDDELDRSFWQGYDNDVLEEILTNLMAASQESEAPSDVVTFR